MVGVERQTSGKTSDPRAQIQDLQLLHCVITLWIVEPSDLRRRNLYWRGPSDSKAVRLGCVCLTYSRKPVALGRDFCITVGKGRISSVMKA
jgi:hypothetical protein